MTAEAPGWAEEEKKGSKALIIGLVIVVLLVGCFVVIFVFPRGGGENQPPVTPKNPVASFTYSPSSPSTADTIYFTDTSSDEDGQVVSRLWSFGDETTSTSQNPSHRYTILGTYTVTLTVTDDDGNTDHHSTQIIVLSSTQNEMVFQNFEFGNGTPSAYFYDAWRTTTSFDSSTYHGGTRSVKMIVPALDNENTGATIGINAASSSGHLNLQNATVLSIWVYDTQGSNTIELKLKDSDGTIGPGMWSEMSATKNQWTKISWNVSSYSGVSKSSISSIELYEWNQGTYYFDDVGFVEIG